MSRILRRPMFRGGRVDSRGTGITTGLMDGGRVGLFNGGTSGGDFLKRARIRGPRDLGIVQTLPDRINIGTPRRPKFIDTPLYEDFPEVRQFPLTADAGNIMTDTTITESPNKEVEEIRETADVEAGLESTNTNPNEFKEKPIETPNPNEPDENEVTMTDLERALGLDKARRRDVGDMLGRASAAFLGSGDVREGLAEFMAAESKAGPGRAEKIKSIAGLEKYKQEMALKRAQAKKQYAPGNFEKTDNYLKKQYPKLTERQRFKIQQKEPESFGKQYIELAKDTGFKNDEVFKDSAILFYGDDYKGDVNVAEVITDKTTKSTTLPQGVYTDVKNKMVLVVDENKKIISSKNY